eukprot:g7461.t1
MGKRMGSAKSKAAPKSTKAVTFRSDGIDTLPTDTNAEGGGRGSMFDEFINKDGAAADAAVAGEPDVGLAEQAKLQAAAQAKAKSMKKLQVRKTDVEAAEKVKDNFAPFEYAALEASADMMEGVMYQIKASIRKERDGGEKIFGSGYYPGLKKKTIYKDLLDGLQLDGNGAHKELAEAIEHKTMAAKLLRQWITRKESPMDENECRMMVINALGCGVLQGQQIIELLKEIGIFIILKRGKGYADLLCNGGRYHSLLASQYDRKVLGPELEKFNANPEKLESELKAENMIEKLDWVLRPHDVTAAKLLELYKEKDPSAMAANASLINKLCAKTCVGKVALGSFAQSAEQTAIEEAFEEEAAKLILDCKHLDDSDFRRILLDLQVKYGAKDGVTGTVSAALAEYLAPFVAYHVKDPAQKIEHVVYAALKAREKNRIEPLWWEEKISKISKYMPADPEAEECGTSEGLGSSSSVQQISCAVTVEQIKADRKELSESVHFNDTVWKNLATHLCQKIELSGKTHLLYDVHVCFTRIAEAKQVIDSFLLHAVGDGKTGEEVRDKIHTLRNDVDLNFLGLREYMAVREKHVLMMTGGLSMVREHCIFFVRPYGEKEVLASDKEFAEILGERVAMYHGYDSVADISPAVYAMEETAEKAAEATPEITDKMKKLSMMSPLMSDLVYRKHQSIVETLQKLSTSKKTGNSNKRLLDEITLATADGTKKAKRFGNKKGLMEMFKKVEKPKEEEKKGDAAQLASTSVGGATSSSNVQK